MNLEKLRSGHNLKRWLMLKLAPLVMGAPAPDIVKVLWYRPELFGKPSRPVQQAVMRGPSFWEVSERELFGAFISAQNACRFCTDAHCATARALVGQEVVDAVISDATSAPVRPQARSMLVFLEKLALRPDTVSAADLAPLREAGISDEGIVDAVYICFIFSTFNRVADALGCAALTPKQAEVAAKILLSDGYGVK